MAASGIYSITCANGNRYIGSAVNLRARWSLHRHDLRKGAHHSGHLQSAFDKYGEDAFQFEVLLYCDPENLLLFEQRAMDVLRPEYNACPTAGSWLGRKHTPESKAKQSRAHKGVRLSAEHCASMSVSRMGHYVSPESIAKTAAANTGKKRTPEQRANISAGHKGQVPWSQGKKASAEHRANLSAARRLRPPSSAETRAKQSAAMIGDKRNLGKKHTPESKANMSMAQRLRRAKERGEAAA